MLHPGNFGVIARQTYQELEDSTMRTFFDVCPPSLYKSFNKQTKLLTFHNGSQIVFRSLDTPEKFRSAEFGWFYIDEASEGKEDAFKFLMGRLRRPQVNRLCGFLTTNPVNVTHWIYRWFVQDKRDNFEEFHAPTYENEKHLPEGYIIDLEKNYPQSWVKKYLNGDWGFTEGGVPCFSNFREDIHVRELKYVSESPIYVGLDFGYRRPAAIWTQIDQRDRWVILREYMPENITVHDFARGIIQIQNREFPLCKDFVYYGDPASRQKNDKGEKTSADIMRDHKINVYTRKSSPTARIEIIQKRLQTWHGDSPSMLVNTPCTFFIDALSGGYRYKDRADKEEVDKDGLYEHIVDAAGYLSVGLFSMANAKTLRNDGLATKLANWRYKR